VKHALIALAVLAATAVGTAVVFQSAAREQDYRKLLAHGDAALASGQAFVAIEDYSGAIALRPDSMLAHLRRGETYGTQGDLESAARDFRRAASLDPSATRPLEQWGDILYRQQRYRRAAEVFESRLRLDDRSAGVEYRLGLARYREGNLDAAIAALEQAARLDPQMAEVPYLLGLCLQEKNQASEAISAFQTAIRLAPGFIAAREELADLYADLGRSSEEIQQLQVLAGLDANRIERRIAVALAHARAGHADLAVLTLANILDQAPDRLIVYAALGRVWLQIAESRQDRPDAIGKALEALARAAASASATSETKMLYGRALFMTGQFEAAERMLQQATERWPAEPGAFALYADVAERLRHYGAARTALVAYSSLLPEGSDFARRAIRIGALSLRLSDPTAAIEWFSRASASAPRDARSQIGLAKAHLSAGDRDAAQRAVKRGLELDPANAELLALARTLS
jgi:tetratricopeptide (TPR) repeat protein